MNPICSLWERLTSRLEQLPYSPLALLARFGLAALFWQSGQTKVSGLALDPLAGRWEWGWPRLNDSAIYLFAEEYKLPLLPPDLAALLAAGAEHLFPLLLLCGLATRFSALALLVMTLVIQLFVYPDAYPTHALWACALLLLISRGAGNWSVDHLWQRCRSCASSNKAG